MTNNRPYQHILDRQRQRQLIKEYLKAAAGILILAAISVLLVVIFNI